MIALQITHRDRGHGILPGWGHAVAEYSKTAASAKKLTNDLTFVNPNTRKIPYNECMCVTIFSLPLASQACVQLALPVAIRRQATTLRREHASLPPQKMC
jgi:hypothetical protein